MAGTMSSWVPETNYVHSGFTDGRYVSGLYNMLAAGPSRLAQIGSAAALAGGLAGSSKALGEVVHPLGLIQQASLSQNKQYARIFEMGSERSLWVPGRAVGQLQLGRVYYHGATLQRMLYAAFQDQIEPTTVKPMLPSAAAAALANPHNVIVPPGFENVFLNMGSDMFNNLFGLLWYIKDSNGSPMGAIYLEACNMPSHGLSADAQGLVMQENAQVQYERMVPVNIGAVPLISAATTANAGGSGIDFPGLET